MATGSRAYDNNLPRLAKSGELAVKVLVDISATPTSGNITASLDAFCATWAARLSTRSWPPPK